MYISAISLIKVACSINESPFQWLSYQVTEQQLLALIVKEFKTHGKEEFAYQSFIEAS